jgi:hypothetical protein
MYSMTRFLTVLLCVPCAFVVNSFADEPCKSGPQPNQRPGPYSSLVSVGKERGTQHCYICEAGDKPMVIVFARTLSEPLGKLVSKIDKSLAEHKTSELRAWVTFLVDNQPAFDPKVVDWGKKSAAGAVPLGIFEDVVGPPAYLLNRDADVTVLLAVKQKVVANFAFRAAELNDDAIGRVFKDLPKIVTMKK